VIRAVMKMKTVTPKATPAISSRVCEGLDSKYRRATLKANTASPVRDARRRPDPGFGPRRARIEHDPVPDMQAAINKGID